MSLLKPRGPTPDYPKCRTHSHLGIDCKHHCQDCDIPVCERCVSSTVHTGHNIVDMKTALQIKKEVLQRDLQELETDIYPTYQEIASTIPKITQSITDLKALMDSNDILIVSAYKSRNGEFRKLPIDKFSSQKVNGNIKIGQHNGSPSASSFTIEEPFTSRKTTGAESSPKKRPLLEPPIHIKVINTGYKGLHSVACVDDETIWTSGLNKTMKLYNFRGDLVKSKDTNLAAPLDITVTKSGDLVYADYKEGTVNIIKDTKQQVVISMTNWKPRNVCSTFSGDLLVVMVSDDDNRNSKIVRFSGSNGKEKQSIQFSEGGQSLFSSNISSKYISENRNLDVCVSDSGANAVVVFTQAGTFRFRYTASGSKKPFQPIGITTDSQSRILVTDHSNIHILDQDGQFLRFIDNCDLQTPWGLCVDSRDNLFVAEYKTGIVKKIQYSA